MLANEHELLETRLIDVNEMRSGIAYKSQLNLAYE